MFDQIVRHYSGRPNWDVTTLYLYFGILILTGIMGYISQYSKPFTSYQPKSAEKSHRYNYTVLFALFLILLPISGLRIVGTDYPNYQNIYSSTNSVNEAYFGIEPGFLLINKILQYLGFSFEFVVFIFSFITIYLVFRAILDYSGKINISLALFAYVSLYYLPGFNMIRMYLAASIVLYSFKYFSQEKLFRFYLILTLCIFVHYSVVIVVIPTLGYLIYRKNKTSFVILYIIIFILSFKIVSTFSELTLIDRYTHYLENNKDEINNNIGLLHWVINIPLIILYLYSKRIIPNNKYLTTLFVFTLCELLIGLLSYKITILGRSLVYYNILFIIVVPIIIQQLKIHKARWSGFIIISYYVYLFYRFYNYLTEYLYLDGIMPYKNILS